MKKRIMFISFLGVIVLLGFNNCGEGFHSSNVGSSILESTGTPVAPPINDSSAVQITLKTKPAAYTKSLQEEISYEINNLKQSDKITCKKFQLCKKISNKLKLQK